MRYTFLFLALLLAGCQTVVPVDQASPPNVMSVWAQYRDCLRSQDVAALSRFVDEIGRAAQTGLEPPSWMKSWSVHVSTHPLRTSVDIRALGAACTLHAASVMAEQHQLPHARLFYHRVLSQYPEPAWAFYREQAHDALSRLERTASPVIALRPGSGPTPAP